MKHRAGEYGRGTATTNTNYFSVFKRGIKGVYQHCDEKYLHRYLAEFDFRYNNRSALDVTDSERATEGLDMTDDTTTEKKPSRAVRKLWGRRRYDNYFQALGEFVHCFTMAEQAVSACLHHHAKVSTDAHRALFSGVRTKEGISFLRRLAEVGEIDPAEWHKLKPLLDHLSVINGVRNKLLHQGADGIEEDDQPFISNLRTALTWDKLEEFPVTLGHLRDMTYDLNTIFFAISHRHSGSGWGYRKRDRPRLERRSNAPWLYKLPAPTRIHRPHNDEFAKLRLQPAAYRRKS